MLYLSFAHLRTEFDLLNRVVYDFVLQIGFRKKIHLQRLQAQQLISLYSFEKPTHLLFIEWKLYDACICSTNRQQHFHKKIQMYSMI